MSDQTPKTSDHDLRALADPEESPVLLNPHATVRVLAAELLAARATLARITAMVDHGLHSEDPDEHDCAVDPCWAVVLRRALGIQPEGADHA